MQYWFTNASGLFETVRTAAIELEQTKYALDRMKARELKTQSYTNASRGTDDTNGLASIDIRIDFESMMQERIDNDRELISLGEKVLFGDCGKGGVKTLLSTQYVDCCYWYYCAGLKWSTVAALLGKSDKTCRTYAQTVLDQIDAYGLRNIFDGLGIAEEE